MQQLHGLACLPGEAEAEQDHQGNAQQHGGLGGQAGADEGQADHSVILIVMAPEARADHNSLLSLFQPP